MKYFLITFLLLLMYFSSYESVSKYKYLCIFKYALAMEVIAICFPLHRPSSVSLVCKTAKQAVIVHIIALKQ